MAPAHQPKRDSMFISPAYAQAAGETATSGGIASFLSLAPLFLVFVVFYFLLIRPQNKKMKEHRAQIDSVKKGDKVVTGGGLIGKVTRVDEHEVEIELARAPAATMPATGAPIGVPPIRTIMYSAITRPRSRGSTPSWTAALAAVRVSSATKPSAGSTAA